MAALAGVQQCVGCRGGPWVGHGDQLRGIAAQAGSGVSTRSSLGIRYQGTRALLFTLGSGREAIAERETALRYHCETTGSRLFGLELSHVWLTYINHGYGGNMRLSFCRCTGEFDIHCPIVPAHLIDSRALHLSKKGNG